MSRPDTTQRDRERSAEDEYQLGVKYTRGIEVTQDYGMAAKLFEKAAEQGHAKAQTALGFAYHLGRGVARNDAEAVKWFRKAAEQGESAAQYNLGYAYFAGEGITQNDKEAVAWFRKAAEQGFADAENDLAVMYARGRRRPRRSGCLCAWRFGGADWYRLLVVYGGAKTSPAYRQALRSAKDNETALTNVFTGRPARGIVNRLVREVGPMSDLAPDFPLATAALAPLRSKSEMAGSADFSPLWAGQAVRLTRELPAAELTKQLAAETLETFRLLRCSADSG